MHNSIKSISDKKNINKGLFNSSVEEHFLISHSIYNESSLNKIDSIAIGLKGVNNVCAIYYTKTNSIILFVEKSNINPPSKEEIMSYLTIKLPAELLPKKIITLIQLPLTDFNKIDKSALYELVKNYEYPYIAPVSVFETEVIKIWSEVLNQEKIGIYDNFFDLGGSLKTALLATAKIAERFNVDIPYGYFYQAQTAREFAQAIETNNFVKPKWVSLINNGQGVPIYWILNGASALKKILPDDQGIYVINTHYDFVRINDKNAIPTKALTVENICAEFVEDILKIHQGHHCVIGGFSMGATFACEVAQQLKKRGIDVDLLVLLDPLESKDKSVDKVPIWRFKRWLRSLYYFYTNKTPPDNFIGDYVLQVYRFLKKRYAHPKFDGKVLLIQRKLNIEFKKRDWTKMADPDNLIYYVLDTEDHLGVVKDKKLQRQWVNKIREIIYQNL